MKVDAFGTWLRASNKDYFDQNDRAIQAIYLEAFEGLCKRGYVRQESGDLFRLTGSGFAKARDLASDDQPENTTAALAAPPLSAEASALLDEIEQCAVSQRKGITIFDDSELGAGKCHYFPYLFSIFENDGSGSVTIIDFAPLSRVLKELIDHGYLTAESGDSNATYFTRTSKAVPAVA
jgi:hypothetical protein